MAVFVFVSGCRESNPVYIHPMDAYYRYTTARCITENVCGTIAYITK